MTAIDDAQTRSTASCVRFLLRQLLLLTDVNTLDFSTEEVQIDADKKSRLPRLIDLLRGEHFFHSSLASDAREFGEWALSKVRDSSPHAALLRIELRKLIGTPDGPHAMAVA